MKYFIFYSTNGKTFQIEITQEEYLIFLSTRRNLFEILFLEEELDLVLENYIEYENELLSISSRQMLFSDFDYFSASKERNLITRRIANLLSSCRMYLDHCSHHINNIYGKNSSFSISLHEEKSKYYDLFFGYRLLEELRNHTQHRGVPFHNLVFSSTREEDQENIHFLYNTNPRINIDFLIEDSKIKSPIKEELKIYASKNGLDIKPFIREYVESIGKLQIFIRDSLKDEVCNWEDILVDLMNKCIRDFGGNGNNIVVACKENEHQVKESKTIFKEFNEKRKLLEKKNHSFINLHKCYVSNK